MEPSGADRGESGGGDGAARRRASHPSSTNPDTALGLRLWCRIVRPEAALRRVAVDGAEAGRRTAGPPAKQPQRSLGPVRAAAGAEVLRWPPPSPRAPTISGADPDRPRPAGASAGARPAAGRRGADRGRGRAPVRDGAEPHPALGGPGFGAAAARASTTRAPVARPSLKRRGAGVPRGGAGGEPPGAWAAGHGLEHPRPARGAAARLGVRVCTATVHRAVQRRNLEYRPPATTCGTARTRRRRGGRGGPGVAAKALAPPANSASVYLDEWGEVHRHRLAKVWQRRGCPR